MSQLAIDVSRRMINPVNNLLKKIVQLAERAKLPAYKEGDQY